MHTRTYSHPRSTPTGTSTTTDREVRFSPLARASRRRYGGRRRLRAAPDPPFPTPDTFAAHSRLRPCRRDAERPARTPSSRRIRSQSWRNEKPAISGLSHARAERFARGNRRIGILRVILDRMSRDIFLSILELHESAASTFPFRYTSQVRLIRFLCRRTFKLQCGKF